ncbi:unnamed protein product [Periconia digitata]|uniref:Uncharacterized protein n=1 Tax=Periconia digitata TaxID=1303443 RepID=A0A9W4UJQ1_9PLEO|nr:unnamed protein product [Periconia digitata]
MAPSRAMSTLPFYCGARAYFHHTYLSTSCRTIFTQHAPIAQPLRTHRLLLSTLPMPRAPHMPASSPLLRSYSTAIPEPPDHLNERELHVFNKIRDALEPVQLEVCVVR